MAHSPRGQYASWGDAMVTSDPGGADGYLTSGYSSARNEEIYQATLGSMDNEIWHDWAKHFHCCEVMGMDGIGDLAEVIRQSAANPRNMIIRGALTAAAFTRIDANRNALVNRRKHWRGGIEPDFIEVPRSWLMIDIDDFVMRGHDDLAADPESVI